MTEIQMNNTSMHRRGHVLVLSGWWGPEMLDDLSVALADLKLALPRHNGPKSATLHLLNFQMSLDSVSGALSLLRRNFISANVVVSLVAEGRLAGAGVLFLASANTALAGATRKIYENCKVELSAGSAHWAEGQRLGFESSAEPRPTLEQVSREILLLGDAVVQSIAKGETWKPRPAVLLSAKLVDKVIRSHSIKALP